jgi:hypothetical protein
MRPRIIILMIVLSTFEANSIGQRLSLFNEKVDENNFKRVA